MVCTCAAWPSVARAEDPRVDELAQRVREIQRQVDELKALRADKAALKDLEQGTAAQLAQLHKRMDAQTSVSMPNGRLTVVSADGGFSVALRATVQFDAGYFSQGRNPPGVDLNSGTNFRRAQFGFVGTAWHDWSYNFTYDFGGSGTENRGYLYRAYIEYDGLAPLAFRIGAFSAFDSMEDATGGANLALMERPAAVTIAGVESVAAPVVGEAQRLIEHCRALHLLIILYRSLCCGSGEIDLRSNFNRIKRFGGNDYFVFAERRLNNHADRFGLFCDSAIGERCECFEQKLADRFPVAMQGRKHRRITSRQLPRQFHYASMCAENFAFDRSCKTDRQDVVAVAAFSGARFVRNGDDPLIR